LTDEKSRTMAERQAEWVCGIRYDDIPADVVRQAKKALLDYLGVATRGSTLPQGLAARHLLSLIGVSNDAAVIGGGRSSVPYAAYANGTFGHSLEFDDSHFNCGHPGVCVIPAALATAEKIGADGRALLLAIVAGYQSMVYSMGPINRRTLDIGWHGMKVGGVFGAAAASGKLLGLSTEQLTNALAIAGSDASGTMEYDQSGGEVKRYHAGMASRAGAEAAFLAKAGLTGPATIFEGHRGVYNLFTESRHADPEQFWRGDFHIMMTAFKMYPAVGTVHAALDALNMILDRRPGTDDIESVEVGLVHWAIPHGAAIVHPRDMIGAQFSLAFACALRIVTGDTAIADFVDPAYWADERIKAIASSVTPVAIEVPEGAHELCARVTIRYRDGTIESAFQPEPAGFPGNPASLEQINQKFRSVTKGILAGDAAERLIELVGRAELLKDVDPLWAILNDRTD
jgi:2-methylcitrate dehydratase PrpD